MYILTGVGVISYALKRVTRSSGLFIALLLGVTLASIFFAGINIGADSTAKAALDQQLERVLVDITAAGWGVSLSSANWTTAAGRVSSVSGVTDWEVISRCETYIEAENYTFFRVVGINDNSRVYKGLNVTSGSLHLGKNEAYVWTGSPDRSQLKVNSTLTLNFTLSIWDYNYTQITIILPLKIVGLAGLDEMAYALVSGQYERGVFVSQEPGLQEARYYGNLLIVSWEKTFAELLDLAYSHQPPYSPFNTDLLMFLDRDSVINPWDIGTSQDAVNKIVGQINNVLAEYELYAYGNLNNALSMYNFLSMTLRLSFMVVALPVFFVAWYVGTTVSDVSFNLRRREIGLLLAKGFSSGQLFRLFLSESILVGFFGGLLGIGFGFFFSPYFAPAMGGEVASSTPVLTPEIVVITVIFGTSITILSTFRPSRKAAKLPAVDALKEYILVEETKPYKRKWPWVALLLGSYKIGMFLIGIPNVAQLFIGRPLPVSNILLMILLAAWTAIDSVLTPLGGLLFFWGLTKVLIRGSLRFQKAVAKAAKFLGDLGTLATKNVERNPARTASIAFLIALIIGYGFQTVITLASSEDYMIRQVKTSVGTDIRLSLDYLANSTQIIENLTNLGGIESMTLTYSYYGETSLHSVLLIAIRPVEWLSTAYYEDEWFTGNNAYTALHHLADRNNTIVLEYGIARDLDLGMGDFVAINMGGVTTSLEVVGFFGYEVNSGIQPLVGDAQPQYLGSQFWSYIPANLYYSLENSLSASQEILVKVAADADEEFVVAQIRNLNSTDILYVQSAAEQLEERQENLVLSGTGAIQRIGVIFSVLAGSVATALGMIVSLLERKKEMAIMNVRGISFKQLVAMLLSESLAVVLFSVILGVVVGVIIANGSISALNSTLFTLVRYRLVLPLDSVLILSTSIILVFILSIMPIVVMSKRYTSRLERIVRA
ncbi:MAG: ABC transporter permease [Candidatus Bathyarchaeota archaeon]|nr:MAG: ABC transporter permease [Candidatus Bathyarchaeota archaeon]